MERNNFKWKILEKKTKDEAQEYSGKKLWYDKKNSYRFWLRKVNYFTFDFRAYWIMWKNNIYVFRGHISLPKKNCQIFHQVRPWVCGREKSAGTSLVEWVQWDIVKRFSLIVIFLHCSRLIAICNRKVISSVDWHHSTITHSTIT